MKKTAQTRPVPGPAVKASTTNGMPPTAPPIWGTRSNTATQATEEALAVEQEGDGGEDGGRRRQRAAEHGAAGVLHRGGVAGQALGQLVEEALDAVGHVGVPQLRPDEGELAEVVDHLGEVLAQVPHLAGGGGTEDRGQRDDGGEQRDEDDGDGGPPLTAEPHLEAGHDGGEGEGQQRAEDEPGEGPAGAPDEAGQGEEGHEGPEHPEHRAPVEVDHEVVPGGGGGGGCGRGGAGDV